MLVHRMTDMPEEAMSFGVCAINHLIYCVGGLNVNMLASKKVVRYDLLKHAWEQLDADLPVGLYSSSLLQVKKRFIYLIGGMKRPRDDSDGEVIYKLDTRRLENGWEKLQLECDNHSGCQYGVMPLKEVQDWRDGTDKSQFLVFGGVSIPEVKKSTWVLEINNKDFTKTTLTPLHKPNQAEFEE